MVSLQKIRCLIKSDLFCLLVIHLLGSRNMIFDKYIGGIICVFTVILILKNFFRNKHPIHLPSRMKFMVIAYLVLDVLCVIIQSYFRGKSQWGGEWLNFMTYHFVVSTAYLAFLLPFIVFYDYRKFNLSFLCKYGGGIAVIFICYFLISYRDIINASLGLNEDTVFDGENFPDLFNSCAFLLLLTPYIKEKKKLLPIFILGLATLFTTIIFARRGSSLSIVLVLISSFLLYIKKISTFQKTISILFVGILLLFGFFRISSSNMMDNLKEKGMYDSRKEVSEYFEKDMLKSSDLYFGRGMNGQYYCPQIYQTKDGIVSEKYRYAIETGFYHLILKGGLIFAILHVLILAISALKGLFFSKNNILKAFSLWIMLSLWELYPFGWPSFSIKFLLIWIGVCLCNNKSFLKMNDTQICEQLKIS